jgi:hypothetical protein
MSSRVKRFSWGDSTSTRNGYHRRVVIPSGSRRFQAGNTPVNRGPRISTAGILSPTKLEETQVTAGDTRPTEPKNFNFP